MPDRKTSMNLAPRAIGDSDATSGFSPNRGTTTLYSRIFSTLVDEKEHTEEEAAEEEEKKAERHMKEKRKAEARGRRGSLQQCGSTRALQLIREEMKSKKVTTSAGIQAMLPSLKQHGIEEENLNELVNIESTLAGDKSEPNKDKNSPSFASSILSLVKRIDSDETLDTEPSASTETPSQTPARVRSIRGFLRSLDGERG